MVALGQIRNPRRALGDFGERLACEHLLATGYRILDRNYRIREGEIDVIAEKDGIVAFVEVRTRKGARMGTAVQSITRAKAERLVLLADAYIAGDEDFAAVPRIDVIAIDFTFGGKPASLVHIENAVTADWIE
jgi:putative endonuclease